MRSFRFVIWLYLNMCWFYWISYFPKLLATEVYGVIVRSERDLTLLRNEIEQQIVSRHTNTALEMLDRLEEKFGGLSLGIISPSFYNLKGVALYESNRILEAIVAFQKAVRDNPEDLTALINLVSLIKSPNHDISSYIQSIEAITNSKLVMFAVNQMNWKNLEYGIHQQEKNIIQCLQEQTQNICDIASIGLGTFFFPPLLMKNLFATKNQLDDLYSSSRQVHVVDKKEKIKIGFLLKCIDNDPVINLSHRFFQSLLQNYHHNCELIAFFLQDHQFIYEYQYDIIHYFSRSYSLVGRNITECIQIIRIENIDILIDMNGLNTNLALFIMKERPAKILISNLGDPLSTGANFIDYQIVDRIVAPPESSPLVFTEKLLMLPTTYLVNSYLHWQSTNPLFYSRLSKDDFFQRIPKYGGILPTRLLSSNLFLIGAFHNWNKITPMIFHVWMNLLQTIPNSLLVLHLGPNRTNAIREAAIYGISAEKRFVFFSPTDSYEEHYYLKSAIDIYVDTIYKNGHVTSLDAQFIGLPCITVSGLPSRMSSRSTESIQYHSTSYSLSSRFPYSSRLDQSPFGVVSSIKEYEDLITELLKNKSGRRRLQLWRRKNEASRSLNKIFQFTYFTKEFFRMMHATLEVDSIVSFLGKDDTSSRFHIFSP